MQARSQQSVNRLCAALVAVLALVTGLGLGGAAQASAADAVIVSPRAGQKLTRPPLRMVVRAGREHGDLVARLNGVSIGAEFARSGRNRRTLRVSASHGLRHGRNVLTVRARVGTTVRRAKVAFVIANRHPIPGAGRARRSVAGRWIRLKGRIVRHPRGPAAKGVRWSVVRAPISSRLRKATRARPAPPRPPCARRRRADCAARACCGRRSSPTDRADTCCG
jgi:hypothetical protein